MTVYILSYIYYILITVCGICFNWRRKYRFFSLIPFFMIVAFRGMVGVDTPRYVDLINIIHDNDWITYTYDIGFELLVLLFTQFTDQPFFVILMINIFITFFIFYSRNESNVADCIIYLGVVPYFYLDWSLNGLRSGLSFSLILFSNNFFNKNQIKKSCLIELLAASVHKSTVLFILENYLVFKRVGVRTIASIAILSMLLFEIVSPKISDYTHFSKPESFSGISTFVLLFILILLFFTFNSSQIIKRTIITILLFVFVGLCFTYDSYAFLRIMQAQIFFLMILIIRLFGSYPINTKFRTLMILFLIMSSAFRINNFSVTSNDELTFNPYVTIFNDL